MWARYRAGARLMDQVHHSPRPGLSWLDEPGNAKRSIRSRSAPPANRFYAPARGRHTRACQAGHLFSGGRNGKLARGRRVGHDEGGTLLPPIGVFSPRLLISFIFLLVSPFSFSPSHFSYFLASICSHEAKRALPRSRPIPNNLD